VAVDKGAGAGRESHPDEPHDTAIVIRGGESRDPDGLRTKVMDAIEDGDGAVVSVFCTALEPGETTEDAIERLARAVNLPHGKISTSTAGRIRGRGLPLTRDASDDQGEFHYHVTFPEPVTFASCEGFLGTFGDPEPNPAKGVQ